MRKVICAFGVAMMTLGLGVSLPGCAEDNEATANIKGQAPTGGPKTQAEYGDRMKGAGGGLKGTGYPGTGKKN